MLYVLNVLLFNLFFANAQTDVTENKPTTISVYKYDNSKQCEWASGVPLKTMEKELKGIKVVSSIQKSDGKMYASKCGGPTGMINVYEIREKDVKKAEKLGFKRLSTH